MIEQQKQQVSLLTSFHHRKYWQFKRKRNMEFITEFRQRNPSQSTESQSPFEKLLLIQVKKLGWRQKTKTIQKYISNMCNQLQDKQISIDKQTFVALCSLRQQRIFLQIIKLIRQQIYKNANKCSYMIPILITTLNWYQSQVAQETIWLLCYISNFTESLPIPLKTFKILKLILQSPTPNFFMAGFILLQNLTAISEYTYNQLIHEPSLSQLIIQGSTSSGPIFSAVVGFISNMIVRGKLLNSLVLQINFQLTNLFLSYKTPPQLTLCFLHCVKQSIHSEVLRQSLTNMMASRVIERLQYVKDHPDCYQIINWLGLV